MGLEFGDPVVNGDILVRPAIQSPDYVPGQSGWAISRDGTVEFNSGTYRGNVHIVDPVTLGEILIQPSGITGVGVVVALWPDGGQALYPAPAEVYGNSGPWGTGGLQLSSPSKSLTEDQATILLATSQAGVSGAQIYLQAPGDGIYVSDRLYVRADGSAVRVCPSSGGVSAAATTSGADTTTSSSYANMAGTGSVTSFGFTKQYDDTRIRVRMELGAWCNGAVPSGVDFGVRIDTTDYQVGTLTFNVAGQHMPLSSTGYISGVPSGAHTVQARWKRHGSGTGTITRDANDWLSITAEECT